MNAPCIRLILCLLLSRQVLAAKSYYVSSVSGNDAYSGANANAPWRSIAKINQLKLGPGDRIFLKAGEKFRDAGLVFTTDDSGTTAQPIVVDIYGGDARAVVTPPPGQHGINIYNTGGVTVRNLHLLGQGPVQSAAQQKNGVSLWCDLKNGEKKSGLRFENLLVAWFYKGIVIGADDASWSGFADVVVADCTVQSCLADGIVSFGRQPGTAAKQSHRNLQVLRTTVSKCYGDPNHKESHSGSGIILSGTIGGLIDECVAHDNGGGATGQKSGGGPVGIWGWGCDGVTIQRSLVYNQKTTPGVSDGGGFDIDGGATNCVIQHCYSYHNEGYGFLVCEFKGAAPLTHATVRYNVSWHDGRARDQAGLGIWNGNPSGESFREVIFHHNTVIVDESADSVVKLGYESNPLAAVFYNNLFIRTGGSKLINVDRHVDTLTFKGNLYWTASGDPQWLWGKGTFQSLDAWRATARHPETHRGASVGSHADPRLTDARNGHAATRIEHLKTMTAFLPAAGSPAVNAALDLSSPEFGPVAPSEFDFSGASLGARARTIGARQPLPIAGPSMP